MELKLNYTEEEVYADFEDAPVSYVQKLQQDWLSLFKSYNDLLKRVLETRDSIKLYIFLQNVKGYSIDKNQIDFIFKTHLPELEER